MASRIRSAVSAKTDPAFVIMARTDAAGVEGMDAAIERAQLYRDAGADMIFAEALTELAQYRRFTEAVKIPVLANITEFGKTPLFTVRDRKSAGVSLVLYPLSAFRAMNAAG
jgi:methylisocitrate lyase